MKAIATKIYGAADITADSKVRGQIKQLQESGYGHYPVCVAKTQYSFSTDPQLRGAPSGHVVNVREVRLAAGAEFVVMVCGDIMTMPGLPKVPVGLRHRRGRQRQDRRALLGRHQEGVGSLRAVTRSNKGMPGPFFTIIRPWIPSGSTRSSASWAGARPGKVYLATDPFGNKQVAIKVAYPDALKSSEDGALYRSMFLNEAALAGKLHHPHIVQIFDAVVEDEFSYIVMEYVEGGTLEKFCEPASLLDPAEVAEIIFKCVRALAFASRLGLTHRDIKPGNILHVDGTDIKIADFGASINTVSDRTMINERGLAGLHGAGAHHGRRAGLRRAPTSTRSGVVMYYLLAGRLPFSGANTMSVIYQIVNTEPEPPSAHRQGLLPELDAIVTQGDGQGPARQRYATWEEFGQALAEVWKKLNQAGEREQSDTERFNLCRTLSVLQGLPGERAVGGAAHLQVAQVPAQHGAHQGGRPRRLVLHPGRRLRARDARQAHPQRAHGGRLLRRDGLPRPQGRAAPLGHRHHDLGLHHREDPRRGPAASPRSPAGGSSTSASSTRWSSASRPPTSSSP